jgi:hypothetical protein
MRWSDSASALHDRRWFGGNAQTAAPIAHYCDTSIRELAVRLRLTADMKGIFSG